jgi:predicted HicB family RNase H-like nuclease
VDDRKTRMSIDVEEKEHKKIKMRAAKEGVSIRAFVTDCIREKIRPDQEGDPRKK